MLNVEISFKGSEDDGTLSSIIYNPSVLPVGLLHQIRRYGFTGPSTQKPYLSGRVNGSRKAITELVHTYGLTLEVVPYIDPLAPASKQR